MEMSTSASASASTSYIYIYIYRRTSVDGHGFLQLLFEPLAEQRCARVAIAIVGE